jgi:uncharacterized protein with PQ loop repeat
MDFINSIYEVLGGIFVFHNCYKLYKEKDIKGISIPATIFFTSWSYWNIYYYYGLNQKMSLLASFLIATANSIWLILAFFIKNKK